MILTMTEDAQFWDKIARKYAAQPVSDPEAYAHTLGRVRSYLKADDAVLELGCGTGTSALKLADACGTILATDIAPEMIAIAREKGEGTENVSFAVSGSDVPDAKAGNLDAVLAFNLLHLVPDLDLTLARAAEVLKPGGHLITKTVCLGGSWYLRPVIALMRLFGKAPHVTFLRPEAVDAAIRKAGFEIVETAEHNKGAWGHFVVARKV